MVLFLIACESKHGLDRDNNCCWYEQDHEAAKRRCERCPDDAECVRSLRAYEHQDSRRDEELVCLVSGYVEETYNDTDHYEQDSEPLLPRCTKKAARESEQKRYDNTNCEGPTAYLVSGSFCHFEFSPPSESKD